MTEESCKNFIKTLSISIKLSIGLVVILPLLLLGGFFVYLSLPAVLLIISLISFGIWFICACLWTFPAGLVVWIARNDTEYLRDSIEMIPTFLGIDEYGWWVSIWKENVLSKFNDICKDYVLSMIEYIKYILCLDKEKQSG